MLLHQTIIGEEALLRLAMAGRPPTSSWDAPAARLELRRVDVPVPSGGVGGPDEPDSAGGGTGCVPVTDPGHLRHDFGDTAGMTPLIKMHTLGHDFVPDPIHAGGLRYHG